MSKLTDFLSELGGKLKDNIQQLAADQASSIVNCIAKLNTMAFSDQGNIISISKSTVVEELTQRIHNEHTVEKDELKEQLDQLQTKLMAAQQMNKSLEMKAQSQELNREKSQKKEIFERDQEIQNLKIKSKSNNVLMQKLERESVGHKEQADVMSKMTKRLTDDLSAYETQYASCEEQLRLTAAKLDKTTSLNRKQMDELNEILANEMSDRKSIEAELFLAKEIIEQFRQYQPTAAFMDQSLGGGGGETGTNAAYSEPMALQWAEAENAFKTQIHQMQMEIHTLESEKNKLLHMRKGSSSGDEQRKIGQFAVELEKREQQLNHKKSVIAKLRKNHAHEQQELVEQTEHLKLEIDKLRELDESSRKEKQQLQDSLAKQFAELQQLRETVCTQERILRVRTELINVQENQEESPRKKRCNDYIDDGKKRSSDVRLKNHEIQSIYENITSRQMKVSQQEQVIQTLETEYQRLQYVRQRQMIYIGRLEQENANLRIKLKSSFGSSSSDKSNVTLTQELVNSGHNLNREMFKLARRSKRKVNVDNKLAEIPFTSESSTYSSEF